MSAADNRKLIEDIFAGLAVGDATLRQAYLAPDFAIRVMGQSSWSQAVKGSEAVKAYRDYVRSRFKDPGKTVPERIIADGDLVVVEARGDNHNRDGVRYDNHYCLIFRFEDGRIVEMREYMDTAFCERVLGPFPGGA